MFARKKTQDNTQIYKGAAQKHFANGMEYYEQKKFNEALQHWQMARETYDLINFLKLTPHDKAAICNDVAECNWYIGKAYEEINEFGKAMSYYQTALFTKQIPDRDSDEEKHKENIRKLINYRIGIARTYLKDKKLTAAIKEYVEIVNYLEMECRYLHLLPEYTEKLADGFYALSQILQTQEHKIIFNNDDLVDPNFFRGLSKLIDIFQNAFSADFFENECKEIEKLKHELNSISEDTSRSSNKTQSKFFKEAAQTNDTVENSILRKRF